MGEKATTAMFVTVKCSLRERHLSAAPTSLAG
jgi:hypothetical protein